MPRHFSYKYFIAHLFEGQFKLVTLILNYWNNLGRSKNYIILSKWMCNKQRDDILKWIPVLLSGGRYPASSCIGSRLSMMLGKLKGIERREIITEEEEPSKEVLVR